MIVSITLRDDDLPLEVTFLAEDSKDEGIIRQLISGGSISVQRPLNDVVGRRKGLIDPQSTEGVERVEYRVGAKPITGNDGVVFVHPSVSG